MPNIRSAKKKMRQDVKRTNKNQKYLTEIKKGIKSLFKMKKSSKSAEKQKKIYSIIDKAAKVKVIHKNKAARLKSRVMKFFSKAK